MWAPEPDLATAAAAWIHAGGAHHTGFSQSLTTEHLQDFADIADVEFLVQLFQLKYGRDLPAVRATNTWEALAALHGAKVWNREAEAM